MKTNAAGLKIINSYDEDFWANSVDDIEALLNDRIKVSLTENQFSALVSLLVTIDIATIRKDPLFRIINSGAKPLTIAREFANWTTYAGKENHNLKARRKRECRLFLKPGVLIQKKSSEPRRKLV